MQKKTQKKQSKSQDCFFSDEEASNEVNVGTNTNDFFIMIDEDQEGLSINQSSTNKLFRMQENPFEVEIKEQYRSSLESSSMDLEDICLSSQNESTSKIVEESEWRGDRYSKSKVKQQNRQKKIKDSNLIKIQNQQWSSNNEERKIGSHQNRKIRTTVNEEKIKIMEHLFPYIINSSPYKGTVLSLKDVAKIVDLGYSTILHKFKDYRHKGQVQKGLLLKCKDIKRKYNKSLIIENLIKKALKQNEFKTAKQLANFITEKYKFNANRSIISRHLNEMQRERNPIPKAKAEVCHPNLQRKECIQTNQALRQFRMVFLGLKNETEHFYYFTMIRLYMIEGKLSFKLQDKQVDFRIINLTITSTQSQLTEYYPHFVNQTEVFIATRLSSLDQFAFKAFYNQLENQAEDHYLDIQTSSDEQKIYVVFPFKNNQKEAFYRSKIMDNLLAKKISILTVPPKFKPKHMNFIQGWFQLKVMTNLEDSVFETSQKCKESIMASMNNNQASLGQYAAKMLKTLNRF